MPHFHAELVPAMLTPMNRDLSVDFEKAERLAKHLVQNGCDGLLINGTTGESPTLTLDEKIELVKVAKQGAGGKAQIMVGAGSNDTEKTLSDAKKMVQLGIDALLIVVPYYNKPNQRGMFEHFKRIAQGVDAEIVIYNIPSRSVVRMEAETMAKLHRECPNIIGVKQSHPDMDAVSEITALLPQETWLTWCGDDTLTLPMMACGAHGTISVIAHLTGLMMREMIQAVKQGNQQRALELHLKQLHLGKELFFLPNPTVVKTMMAKLGMMEGAMRLPLVEPDPDEMKRIDALLAHYKSLLPQTV